MHQIYQILVIDDEKSILNVVRQKLTKFGYKVEIASDGKEGIRKFNEERFDLVITDILMPGIDGNDIVQHIRSSDKQSTPIIGLSGTPWLLEDSEFDIVFAKPFPLNDLVDAIYDLSSISSKRSIIYESID